MSESGQDAVLEEIVSGFQKLCASGIRHASITSDVFNASVALIPNDVVRSHHIATFAEESHRYNPDDVGSLWGFYVSALASVCVDKKAEVSTERLRIFPRYLGAYLKGSSLTVIGNVGNAFGHYLRSGKLQLIGNAAWGVGAGMLGGEIIVDGSAGQGVGEGMQGGVIRLQGDYESLGRPISGEVYHKGETVWPVPSRRYRR